MQLAYLVVLFLALAGGVAKAMACSTFCILTRRRTH
jgi:hypothetical protein